MMGHQPGLKCVQGKCIVNSISLKKGNRISRAGKKIQQYGAAASWLL